MRRSCRLLTCEYRLASFTPNRRASADSVTPSKPTSSARSAAASTRRSAVIPARAIVNHLLGALAKSLEMVATSRPFRGGPPDADDVPGGPLHAVTFAMNAARFATVRWIFSSRVSDSGSRAPTPASFLPRTYSGQARSLHM